MRLSLISLGVLLALGTAPSPSFAHRGDDAASKDAMTLAPSMTAGIEAGWKVLREDGSGIPRWAYPTRVASRKFEGGNVQSIANAALRDWAASLGFAKSASAFQVREVREGLGSTHVRYDRVIDGTPVSPGGVSVHMTKAGGVLSISCGLDPAAVLSPAKRVIDRAAAEGSHFGASKRPDDFTTRAILVDREGALVPVWEIRYFTQEPLGDWEIWVDGITGEEIRRHDRRWRATGTGRVWTPNPIVALQDLVIDDDNDLDGPQFNGAYREVDLFGLDTPGSGQPWRLAGEFLQIVDDEAPATGVPTRAGADDWMTTRADGDFEAVMCYYHIDTVQRYLRSLGFTNVVNFPIRVDPHGLNGADNSHYVPSGPRLAFGDGCVDDAEEADVIVHEYGHAIQDNQSPNWLNSGEMGALGEGFGDYWSEAHTDRMGFTFNRGKVFDWDAGGLNNGSPCWSGRRVDTAKKYPQDVSGSIHLTGEIWSGALWDLREAIGGDAADSVIIESHFFVEPSAGFGFEDAGLALIQADSALTNGHYEAAIRSVLIARGILEGSLLAPALSEAVAPPTLSQGDSLGLAIRAIGTNPVSRVEVVYGMPAFTETLSLAESAADIWSGTLVFPLDTDTLRYYYRAVDAAGNVAVEPPGAPGQIFTTAILPDGVAPTVAHDAVGDRLDSQFPLTISAVISDNLSLNEDSLFVEYTFEPAKGGAAPTGIFALAATGGADAFAGLWPDHGDRGGRYEYRIVAVDNSIVPNRTTSPSKGVYEFEVTTDSVPPVIVHEAIAEREAGLEDIAVEAIIRDQGNLTGDSVLVEFQFVGTSDTSGTIVMTAESDSLFSAKLPAGLTRIGTYSYRLSAMDAAFVPNRSRFPSDGSFLSFDVVPGGSDLRLIGPNPFGESVAFSVFLEEAAEIRFEIYDIAGRRVAEVATGNRSGAQVFSWDGKNDGGEEAGPGIYLYRFERNGREESGRIVRLR